MGYCKFEYKLPLHHISMFIIVIRWLVAVHRNMNWLYIMLIYVLYIQTDSWLSYKYKIIAHYDITNSYINLSMDVL